MKVYRIIVIVISIVLGISMSAHLYLHPLTQAAINDPVTEEYYRMLKENALKIAKTLDESVLNDETLTGNFYFSQDELVITVESIKAKLTAKIPIIHYHLLEIDDSTIKSQVNVDWENIQYEEENQLYPVWFYIIAAIFMGLFVAGGLYYALFENWFPSQNRNKKFNC